ncbi:MAG: hypothetical protein J3K34DRAFT_465556 [Monoraphidium minutum]|nr:MAG: hypothetical protein J3K34DRAFT_465556 [Monoraphidium minutum]
MPPELLRQGQLSAAGDVEAFTGESAFRGMHYGEVIDLMLRALTGPSTAATSSANGNTSSGSGGDSGGDGERGGGGARMVGEDV